MLVSSKAGQIISDFLDAPSKGSLRSLCEICVIEVRRHLLYLSRTRPAWINELTTLQSLETVAFDVAGEMLASRSGRLAHPVQDFFSVRFRVCGKPDNPDVLYFWFIPFVRSFTEQALWRLRLEENSQIENLKRRMKATLRGPEFVEVRSVGKTATMRCLKESANRIRLDRPFIDYASLLVIVEEAFLRTTNRVEWCKTVFKILDDRHEYCNAVEESLVLRAVVSVNSNYVNCDAVWHGQTASPDTDGFLRAGANLIQEIRDEAKKTVLAELISSGRITVSDAENISQAISIYLTDLLAGGTDSIPDYFRLTFPEESHGHYLTHYKYPFERVLGRCRVLLVNDLKEIL